MQQPTPSKCPMEKINGIGDEILAYIRNKLKIKYGDKKPLRAFHAKSIGLVKAVLKVDDDLPDDLRQGLFKQPATYNAWVRYTNGSGKVSADGGTDVRGMAIKVLNVPGERFMQDATHGNTQDMILFTSKVSIPGSLGKQPLIPKVVLGNAAERIWATILGLIDAGIKAALTFNKGRIKTPNLLEEMYWSATPYRFGEKNIKWHARPLKIVTDLMPEKPGENFLRDRLIKDLHDPQKELAFALMVQFQEDEDDEPVEDPSVEWTTPFYRVGTITLVKNDNIDTPERIAEDRNMNFSPGYAIKEHAPLGGVNQIRIQVYEQLAKERREHPIALM